MSDTPRTDAACFAIVSNDPQSVVVWADVARDLERENAALQKENAALRQDKERLDWLERRTAFFQLFRKDGVVFVQLVGETGPHECTSTRAAIDAARAKEAKP